MAPSFPHEINEFLNLFKHQTKEVWPTNLASILL